MKITICFYQNGVALNDVLNWIQKQVEHNRFKSISVLSQISSDSYQVVLQYTHDDVQVLENVFIFPDDLCANVRKILSFNSKGMAFKGDKKRYRMKREDFKFIYTGALQLPSSNEVFGLYTDIESHFKKLNDDTKS